MGGEGPGVGNRSRAGGFDILEHCHTLGLGVVRLNVPQGGPDAVSAVRKKVDAYGMRCVVSVAPPRTDAALLEYDAAIAAALALTRTSPPQEVHRRTSATAPGEVIYHSGKPTVTSRTMHQTTTATKPNRPRDIRHDQ
jgi:hypothetical protein